MLRDYIFTLIESALIYYMISCVLSCKFTGIKNLIYVIIAIIIDSLFVNFFPADSIIVRSIFFNIFTLALISILFKERIYIKTFFALLNYYIILTSDLIAGNIISYLSKINIDIVFTTDILTLILAKIISLIIILVSIYYFKKMNFCIPKNYWLIIDSILTLFISILLFIMYANSSLQNISYTFSIYVFWISVSFLILSFMVIYFFQEICYFYEKDKEATVINLKTKSLEQQMNHQKIEANELKKIRHDIKNNLSNISNLLKQNNIAEVIAYINAITSAIDETKPIVHSGNNIIDSILNYKIAVCKKDKIKMQINVDTVPNIKISPMDLSAMISNILDNAIEANENIEQLERFILIKIFNYKNYLSIVVKNPYKNNFDNGFIKTSKPDKIFHGYGLQSIITAAEKNNGSFNIFTDNNHFTATVLLPIENNIEP